MRNQTVEYYNLRVNFLQLFNKIVHVYFSPALGQVLHLRGALVLEHPNTDEHDNFREWASKILEVAAPYSPLVVHSEKLPFNFYPTPKSMIDAINELILKSVPFSTQNQ